MTCYGCLLVLPAFRFRAHTSFDQNPQFAATVLRSWRLHRSGSQDTPMLQAPLPQSRNGKRIAKSPISFATTDWDWEIVLYIIYLKLWKRLAKVLHTIQIPGFWIECL